MTQRTQPSYPSNILKPRAKLVAQVVPRIVTVENPVLLYDGSDNEYGAVITQAYIQHLGDNVATTVRLFTKLASSITFDLAIEHGTTLVTGTSAAAEIAFDLIDLPAMSPNNATPDNKGIRLEPGESLYCGLGLLIATGLNLHVEIQEY